MRPPPLHPTNVTRLWNLDGIVAAAKATGLEVEYVPSMGALGFEEQVALMARTGVLLAPHGAALTNLIFMPQHSVLIEVRPAQARVWRRVCSPCADRSRVACPRPFDRRHQTFVTPCPHRFFRR